MNTRSWMMFKVLVNHYHPKGNESIIHFLSSHEREVLKNIAHTIESTDLMPMLYQPQRLIERMHYSWLQPIIEQFSKETYPLVAAALTDRQAKGLRLKTIPISPPLKTFMLEQIYRLLDAAERLPIDYLPTSDLTFLLKWNKKELEHLIDFLSLYDVASEIRHIVDKNHLKKVYSLLTLKQQAYLRICLHQKERLVAPKLDINLASSDTQKIKQVLHARGLTRLSKSLAGQHPDFVWYIAHTLDRGRGRFLLQNYQPTVIANVTALLKAQTLAVINFLKKE